MAEEFYWFIAVGFLAQLVDGAIGMAYGITATSVLLSLGVPPATASACTHAAETVTTGASGLSHWRLGNVDWALFRRLAIPGMVGGAAGAYLLTNLDGDAIKPFISGYLLLLGVFILWKAFGAKPRETKEVKQAGPLALFGGFADAIGGGGWGPIVTSTLVGQGAKPRYVIGTVNLTEFFVTAVISAVFVVTIGFSHWHIIAGLILGGVVAAPIAAYAVKYVPDRILMAAVGVVIVAISARTIYLSGPKLAQQAASLF
jgi:uncharacterized protein